MDQMWFRRFGSVVVVAVGIAASSLAQDRFDYQVRDDMFRAFGGNEAAFKSAMATIEAGGEISAEESAFLMGYAMGQMRTSTPVGKIGCECHKSL